MSLNEDERILASIKQGLMDDTEDSDFFSTFHPNENDTTDIDVPKPVSKVPSTSNPKFDPELALL